ncbi:lymphocyte antigen 6E-like [Eublepharis macularius]|uniref:Lymphocyte antigen 6E-like n=1 Tax=Eublepharis macularius TaxID=481883 RepID=A0AA97JRF4_EUBMA|nr:lymphocyte antigen 6E-like [Eublepharis macularius]
MEKMRVALLVVFSAAVLWPDRALALKCYSCTPQPCNNQCMDPMNCSEEDRYCMTVVELLEIGPSSVKQISKMCMPNCSEIIQHPVFTSCCQRDFCNLNGDAAARFCNSRMLLGILATSVSALLWTGL